MGDRLPPLPKFSVASAVAGSSLTPVLPIHEFRNIEEQAQGHRDESSPHDGHELQDFAKSSRRGREGGTLSKLRTTFDESPSSSLPSRHPSADEHDESEEASDPERDRLLIPPGPSPSSSKPRAASPSSHMPHKKSKSRSPNPRGRGASSHHASSSISKDLASPNGDMNGFFRERAKGPSVLDIPDADSADTAARHIRRSSFSLDDEPPSSTRTPSAASESMMGKSEGEGSKGFFELPESDRRSFLLLVLLYFLQGIPMGLAGGSIPFLLKSYLSYGQIGVYSLASYPYSLKLLWSPIVDAVWSSKFGRRKSWILPIQTLSGFGMIWLGSQAQQMMEKAGENDGAGVWGFTGWWFGLVFMCATQDIAVDGWALTLLSQSNLSYASTAQTVGLTAGQFLSYTVFLALSSADFANKYFRTPATHSDLGLVTLNSYLTFWGWAYLVVTLGLAVLKREDRSREKDSILEVYKIMGGIMKLRNIQVFILIHLIAKIGFQANDGVTNLKLLDKGFSKEDLALTVLIDFPFEISLGYYAGKWSEQYQPVTVWCWAFMGRLVAAGFAQLVVMFFPAEGTTTVYLLVIIAEHVFSTFMSTVMFVAISAFHAKIADPAIGGTYMTLLATVSNLGGTFPRFFVLKFVDLFTTATCFPPTTTPAKSDLTGPLVTAPFDCVLEADKHRCQAGGGTCTIQRDGYYMVNVLCVIFGVVTFWGFIKPAALKLQALPLRAWRIAS